MEVKTYSEILSCHVVLIINLRQNSTTVFPGKGKALNSTLGKLFGMSSGEGSYLEAHSACLEAHLAYPETARLL